MSILSFFKKAPVVTQQVCLEDASECDFRSTQRVKRLLNALVAERTDKWLAAFFHDIQRAAIVVRDADVFTGPDGFPYLAIDLAEVETSDAVSIRNLVPSILQRGLGVVLNHSPKSADWVFSHGDIVNLFLNQRFDSKNDNEDFNGITTSKITTVFTKDQQLLFAQPSADYLPGPTKEALRKFFEKRGMARPMVMLVCRQSGKNMIRQLAFNVFQEAFASEEDMNYFMQQIAWFLPKHYTLLCIPKSSPLVSHFAHL